MYRIIQFVRHKLPFVWNMIDSTNALIFKIRYGRELSKTSTLLKRYNINGIEYTFANAEDIDGLVSFFQNQPKEAYEFFKPHEFDFKSLKKLVNNPSFIMILAKIDKKIIGYAFLRCFFNGKSFRGKIVDISYRGKGIAKAFGVLTTEIADSLNIGLFGTISKANVSSLESSKSSNEIKIIEELPDDYILIQYLPKKQ